MARTLRPAVALVRSVGFAMAGVAALLRSQANARWHLLATVIVIAAGLRWQVSGPEWALLALAMGLVWGLESINTALEVLCDKVQPAQDPAIKAVKDIAAAGVLLGARAAAAAGLAVFLPHWLG